MDDSLKEIRLALYEQRKAFDAYIAPERERLWGYCRRLTGSLWDGEDLVQETMIRAFGGLTCSWTPDAPRSYLFRIATRLWIDRQRRSTLDEVPLGDWDGIAVSESDLSETGFSAMEAVVSTLPPRQRVVLLLTQAFEFTAGEVGEMLELSEGAIKAMLYRARQSLSSSSAQVGIHASLSSSLNAFVDAFNKKDIDALCALFHEDVRIDIIGMGEERGREKLKNSSVKYTLEDEDANEALGFLYGDEWLVLLLKHLPEGGKAVSEVIRVEELDGAIHLLRTYYFCPQTLTEIAQAFGAPVWAHGYHL